MVRTRAPSLHHRAFSLVGLCESYAAQDVIRARCEVFANFLNIVPREQATGRCRRGGMV